MLFRQEAINSKLNKLEGDVILLPKLSYSFLTCFFCVWTLLILYGLNTTHYSRKEAVLGWIEPIEGIVKVYNHLPDSTITKLYVSEGEHVIADDRLLHVKNKTLLTDGQEFSHQFSAKLNKQKLELTNQLRRQKENYSLRRNNLIAQIKSSSHGLIQIKTQLSILQDQETLAIDETKKYENLYASNAISLIENNRTKKELLNIRSNIQTAKRDLENLRNTILRQERELALLSSLQENELGELRSQIYEIDQQLLQIQSRTEAIITAPISGIVTGIQVSVGQNPKDSIPLLTIIPENRKLKVKLLVPVRAVGFLAVGQRFSIRYDAFPYQKFGTYKASVEKISQSIFLPNETLHFPIQLNEPFYVVEASLERESISAYGNDIRLKPGMTLSGDINLEERTLLEWLLEPLYRLAVNK